MANIFLIDDSESVLAWMETILAAAGHEISQFLSGASALKQLHTRNPDLLITDIYMPDEDGIEVLRGARRVCPRLPVIAMSGAVAERSMFRVAKHMGATALLQKPFTAEQLLRTVNHALSQQHSSV